MDTITIRIMLGYAGFVLATVLGVFLADYLAKGLVKYKGFKLDKKDPKVLMAAGVVANTLWYGLVVGVDKTPLWLLPVIGSTGLLWSYAGWLLLSKIYKHATIRQIKRLLPNLFAAAGQLHVKHVNFLLYKSDGCVFPMLAIDTSIHFETPLKVTSNGRNGIEINGSQKLTHVHFGVHPSSCTRAPTIIKMPEVGTKIKELDITFYYSMHILTTWTQYPYWYHTEWVKEIDALASEMTAVHY